MERKKSFAQSDLLLAVGLLGRGSREARYFFCVAFLKLPGRGYTLKELLRTKCPVCGGEFASIAATLTLQHNLNSR